MGTRIYVPKGATPLFQPRPLNDKVRKKQKAVEGSSTSNTSKRAPEASSSSAVARPLPSQTVVQLAFSYLRFPCRGLRRTIHLLPSSSADSKTHCLGPHLPTDRGSTVPILNSRVKYYRIFVRQSNKLSDGHERNDEKQHGVGAKYRRLCTAFPGSAVAARYQ